MGIVMRSVTVAVLLGTLPLSGPVPVRGQSPTARSEADSVGSTLAMRGLRTGALAGGVLGAATLGFLSQALCEASRCSPSLAEGAAMGLVGGAVFGGVAGLVLGSALTADPGPRRDDLPSPRLSLTGGARWAGASEIRGVGASVGLQGLRATTRRVGFGLEVAYLGRSAETTTFTTLNRDGVAIRFDQHAERDVWTGSFVAVRTLGEPAAAGPWVLAGTGVYALRERLTFQRSGGVEPGTPTEGSERSWEPVPGVSVGAGASRTVTDGLRMGGEARLHLLVGAGDGGILPLLSLVLHAGVGGGRRGGSS